jgi:alkaline phosphatase D
MTNRFRFYDRVLQRMSRRELLNAAWKLGAAAVFAPVASSRVIAQPTFGGYPFSLGIASGDPLPDGVVLWTRLAPEPLEGGGMPAANVEVTWEVARDEAFRQVIRAGVTIARPELGHSVHVDVNGLAPGSDYWYRFRAGDEVSHSGRTRTAPAADRSPEALRFAVCGCSHYETGYFTGYRRIAEENFDFIFHTGDYIYEGADDGGRNLNRVRRHRGQEIYSLVDYRNRYALYKSDRDLQAAHASSPFVVSWDDHEVDNDYAGDFDEHDTPAEVFLLRRAAAYQAYFEHMPLRFTSLPRGSQLSLYRRLHFGSLIDFSVLDTRQYRSKQACGGAGATGCVAADAPGRSILGTEQEHWLFDNLASARARWTVIGQQVPTFARDNSLVNPNAAFAMDKWDGYTVSRQRLYTRLKETKVANPIVLSGDVHLHYAADLKLDFRNPKSETVAVEFTNSSITSGGDGADTAPTWARVRLANPHITYHSGRRGYIACIATLKTMRADFKILDAVTVPGAPARVGGSIVVEAGHPGGFTH